MSSKELARGSHCKEGGSEFKVGTGTATYACNGEAAEGEAFPATLPAGHTETGTYNIEQFPNGNAGSQAAISFPIPLESPLGEDNPTCSFITKACPTAYVTKEEQEKQNGAEPPAACKGTVAAPTAEAGHLCFYEADLSPAGIRMTIGNPAGWDPENGEFTEGAATSGALLYSEERVQGHGTWAVTAE